MILLQSTSWRSLLYVPFECKRRGMTAHTLWYCYSRHLGARYYMYSVCHSNVSGGVWRLTLQRESHKNVTTLWYCYSRHLGTRYYMYSVCHSNVRGRVWRLTLQRESHKNVTTLWYCYSRHLGTRYYMYSVCHSNVGGGVWRLTLQGQEKLTHRCSNQRHSGCNNCLSISWVKRGHICNCRRWWK